MNNLIVSVFLMSNGEVKFANQNSVLERDLKNSEAKFLGLQKLDTKSAFMFYGQPYNSIGGTGGDAYVGGAGSGDTFTVYVEVNNDGTLK